MVPIVRVLLLANAKLYGEKKKPMSNGTSKVGGTARTSLSSTLLKTADPRIPFADPRIPFADPRIPLQSPNLPNPVSRQGKVQAHLSG